MDITIKKSIRKVHESELHIYSIYIIIIVDKCCKIELVKYRDVTNIAVLINSSDSELRSSSY